MDNEPQGSPPHMQGKGERPERQGADAGITPAYAGKRQRAVRRTTAVWDHPRICGEKPASRRSTAGWIGSPPHMQGKGGGPRAYQCPWRITPAYAGKSHLHRKSLPAAGDHPRMCGEKSVIIDPVMLWSGSPPHVRGKGRRRVRQAGRAGITPAYAGKSRGMIWYPATPWDHPRMCGEKRSTCSSA